MFSSSAVPLSRLARTSTTCSVTASKIVPLQKLRIMLDLLTCLGSWPRSTSKRYHKKNNKKGHIKKKCEKRYPKRNGHDMTTPMCTTLLCFTEARGGIIAPYTRAARCDSRCRRLHWNRKVAKTGLVCFGVNPNAEPRSDVVTVDW